MIMRSGRIKLCILLALAVGVGCSAGPVAPPVAKTKTKSLAPASPSTPAPRTIFWLSRAASQGALVIGQAPDGTKMLRFDGKEVKVESDGFFVIGFDRDAGPSSKLVATLRDGSSIEQLVPVTAYKWALSYVNTPATGGAKNDAELAARRPGEMQQIGAARAKVTGAKGWRQDMAWPLRYWTIPGGRISGQFGRQRFYQGQPGSPHGGLDIAAATGTPFVAPADGVVVLAAKTAPFTLEGHLLLIDHGNGLNSAFLHCSELLVSEGQVVKQGQIIGKVGATGRAEGAHLHWGLRWRDARVDPLRLVPKAPAPKPAPKKK
jgi:murein DD-endopeptidase MepM/ murein hydrolase activator NlpD